MRPHRRWFATVLAAALTAACGSDEPAADLVATTVRTATTYHVATTSPPSTTTVPPGPTGPVTAAPSTSGAAPTTPPSTTDAAPVPTPPISSGGSGGPPVSGGSTPVSFTAADVCTRAVDADLAGVLPMDIGATGPVVVSVQQALESNGFDVGPSGADGRFGTRTDAAYRAWEAASGRTVSGIVCQEDFDALTGGDR